MDDDRSNSPTVDGVKPKGIADFFKEQMNKNNYSKDKKNQDNQTHLGNTNSNFPDFNKPPPNFNKHLPPPTPYQKFDQPPPDFTKAPPSIKNAPPPGIGKPPPHTSSETMTESSKIDENNDPQDMELEDDLDSRDEYGSNNSAWGGWGSSSRGRGNLWAGRGRKEGYGQLGGGRGRGNTVNDNAYPRKSRYVS